MNTPNAELRSSALDSLEGNWGLAVGTIVIYILLIGGFNFLPGLGSMTSLIIGGPMALGLARFSLNIARKDAASIDQIFSGFNNFGTALGGYLLMMLFVLLWMLLLIVPGIIAAISYSQMFYIIAEDDKIGPMEALDKSKAMMDGYKAKYAGMILTFIGWALLCILTVGIGFLFLIPYMQVSFAKFYLDIKGQHETTEYLGL